MAEKFLCVENLCAWYGESQSLHGVSIEVGEGEIVSLLGRNGAGKTTTLRCIMGLLAKKQGRIAFKAQEIGRLAPENIARLGIAYCPEERGIYASLSVHENLMLPPVVAPGGFSPDMIYDMFPNLRERKNNQGTKLSGGEQQMLAIGRILRTGAKVLLLDEPTEGLAPVIVQKIGEVIRLLKNKGYTILLVEQNFRFVADLVDRSYIVESGKVVDHFDRLELNSEIKKIESYLGI
ncbi:MAG: ABC transporter ATP-binding protein [Pseudomonadota bacterium]